MDGAAPLTVKTLRKRKREKNLRLRATTQYARSAAHTIGGKRKNRARGPQPVCCRMNSPALPPLRISPSLATTCMAEAQASRKAGVSASEASVWNGEVRKTSSLSCRLTQAAHRRQKPQSPSHKTRCFSDSMNRNTNALVRVNVSASICVHKRDPLLLVHFARNCPGLLRFHGCIGTEGTTSGADSRRNGSCRTSRVCFAVSSPGEQQGTPFGPAFRKASLQS